MAKVEEMDSICHGPGLQSLDPYRPGRRAGRPRDLPTWIADVAHGQRDIRFNQRRNLDLYRLGGADGTRVHVQRSHAKSSDQSRPQRVRDDVPGCGFDGPAGEMGVSSRWRKGDDNCSVSVKDEGHGPKSNT